MIDGDRKSKGARGFIFPPRHGEGYEKGVKKEMKGLRGGKLSFIKRKIGSRLSECNISTDSFGGNISSLGKNSIKSRRWGRKVREGGWRREWKRRRKNESWRNRERGRKHIRNRTGSQAEGRREGKRYEDVRKSLKRKKKKLHRNIYKLSSDIYFIGGGRSFQRVTVAKFNLIDRSPRSFITSSKLHR